MATVTHQSTVPRTAKATAAALVAHANRAAADPAKLERAARIVRAALVANRLTIADLIAADDAPAGAA